MFQTLRNLVEAYHFLHLGERKLSSIGLEINNGDEALGDCIYGSCDFILDAISLLLETEFQSVLDILINTLDINDIDFIVTELIKLPVACKEGMRKVKLNFFKDSGKYYTSEDAYFKEDIPVYDIISIIQHTEHRYKDMHICIQFNEMDNIGFPCLILAQDRR